MWQYGETTKTGCPWSVASYHGPGHRTDKNIPHGSRPGRFPEQAGGFVHGWGTHCICLVPHAQPLSFIGSDGSAVYFQEYAETSHRVCGQF